MPEPFFTSKPFLLTVIVVIIVIAIYDYYIYSGNKYIMPSFQPASTIVQQPNNNRQIQQVNNMPDIYNVHNRPDMPNENVSIIVENQPPMLPPPPSPWAMMREYDERSLSDPLTPPHRRGDYDLDARLVYPQLFSYPTRGTGPSAFRKVGMLIDDSADNNDKYKFLLLIGRQRYYNSTQFDYYVTSNDDENKLKFDIDRRTELLGGEHITIPQLSNRQYSVHVDKQLDYVYDNYVV
jgi:hypothetical protein